MPAHDPLDSVLISVPSEMSVLTQSAPSVAMPDAAASDERITLTADLSHIAAVLALPQVRIKNRERTMGKIEKMVRDGAEKLLVIADFDQTLSRAYDVDGSPCWTTHGVFDNATLMPEVSLQCRALSAKYKPIEFDGHMTQEEKVPHMEKWWRDSHDVIVSEHVAKDVIERLVRHSNIKLRDGCTDMMKTLNGWKIPLVIFSAGIGDIISIYLEQRLGAWPENAHLISNMMTYDDQNRVSGFSEPLIHTFNKNGSVIKKESGFFHEMAKRGNVILMGDSMGDLHMDVGVENHREADTLKIGFLNQKDHLLDFYTTNYDIVLVDDQSMTVPNALLKAIGHRN